MARRPESAWTEDLFELADQKIKEIRVAIDPCTVDLSTEERKDQAPARKGFEAHYHRLITLAAEKGINIESCPRDRLTQDMKNDVQLRSLVNVAGLLYNRLLDSYRANHSNNWDGFLAYYRVLSALSQADPEIQSALKPIVSFMAVNSNHEDDEPTSTTEEEA